MRKLTLTTLIALLALASFAVAQPGGPGHGKCGHPGMGPGHGKGMGMGMKDGFPGVRMILMFEDEINLTADQKAKLEQMMVNHRLERIDKKALVKKAQVKLRALMMDENAPESKVMAAIDEVARLKADMRKMQYRHHQAVRSVLTSDQIDKLQTLRKERMERCRKPGMGPGHGKGMGMGMGPCGQGMGYGFAPDTDN